MSALLTSSSATLCSGPIASAGSPFGKLPGLAVTHFARLPLEKLPEHRRVNRIETQSTLCFAFCADRLGSDEIVLVTAAGVAC
jgi:hypothetical protein